LSDVSYSATTSKKEYVETIKKKEVHAHAE
jgi:hypothetical protein